MIRFLINLELDYLVIFNSGNLKVIFSQKMLHALEIKGMHALSVSYK